MKEVVKARAAAVTASIKQGMNEIWLMFETKEEYETFAMAFNAAFSYCANPTIMEAEFHHYEAPLSALPEEEG